MTTLNLLVQCSSRTTAMYTALAIFATGILSVHGQNDVQPEGESQPFETASTQVDHLGSVDGGTYDAPQQATLRRLREQWVRIEFEDTPLEDVMVTLSNETGLTFDLDRLALETANISSTDPITRKLPRARLETALEILLSDLELTIRVRDGIVIVTTCEEAENHPMIQCYPVAPLINADRETESAQSLMELIVSTVSPDTWEVNGGIGTICYCRGVLLVGQTYQVLREIERLLDQLQQQIVAQGGQLRAGIATGTQPSHGLSSGGTF